MLENVLVLSGIPWIVGYYTVYKANKQAHQQFNMNVFMELTILAEG